MVSTPRYRTVLAEYACGILHESENRPKPCIHEPKRTKWGVCKLSRESHELPFQDVSRSVRKTFHQTQLELTGQRQMLSTISEHFHDEYQENTDKH